MDAKFRTALHSSLRGQLPSLTIAVQHLNEEARRLPEEIAASLVGGGPALRAGIRSRLRASLLTDTSGIWFPYRSILGVLSLTSGAWDRVVLSLAGSLPSLIGAAYTGVRNMTQSNAIASDIREGIRKRSTAAVADRLGPLATRFRTEIHRLSNNETASAVDQSLTNHDSSRLRTQPAFLAGLDSLQEQSQQIFDSEIDRAAIPRGIATACGIVGTILFWSLMAGPVVTLYRDYIQASLASLIDFTGDLSRFPRPDLATVLTSVVLSVLPTAIFAMLVLSWVQGRRRVDPTEQAIRDRHREAISRLQEQRVLRLEWDDPLLADAEFLLSAGAVESVTKPMWTEPRR